jgi:DNA polymerase-3 subunit beta
MKVTFATEELKKMLSQLGAVIQKKASQPVYSFARLCAFPAETGFQIVLCGADIDQTLQRTFTKATADGDVDVLLPYGKLCEIIAGVTTAECTIDTPDETKATFRAGKYKAELKTHALADWPGSLERPETALAVVGLPGLKDQISQVEFAVPANDGKFVVSVARIESTPESMRLVGTDGFRLAISDVPANNGAWTLLVPKPAFDLIKKLDGGTQLTILETEGGFFFETELEQATVTRSHGEFPPYQRAIPKTCKTEITCEKGALLDAVRRTKPLADQEKPIIVFKAPENGAAMSLAAASVESSSDGSTFRNMADDEVEAKITGPAVEFPLDANLLWPFLDKATGPITIQVIDEKTAIVFKANSGQYSFFQMPTAMPPAMPAKA